MHKRILALVSAAVLLSGGFAAAALPAFAGYDVFVTSVTSSTADGTYAPGSVIDVTVQFSAPVNVVGAPVLLLATGNSTPGNAQYVSSTASNVVHFSYEVRAGDATSDLDYQNSRSFTFFTEGGVLYDCGDGSACSAGTALPVPGAEGSLGANKAIVLAPASGHRSVTPRVTLSVPNGGESYAAGSSQTMFWSTENCPSLSLSLTADGAASRPLAVPMFNGYAEWTVPELSTVTARIHAECVGDGGVILATDDSDAAFAITGTQPPAPPADEKKSPPTPPQSEPKKCADASCAKKSDVPKPEPRVRRSSRGLDDCSVRVPKGLGYGATGDDVAALQRSLICRGDMAAGLDTGFFGEITQTALRAYQIRSGLAPTGWVGSLTKSYLIRKIAKW